MTNDLIKIKEKYGENMMHLCRDLFPTILEEDGLLFELLSNSFYYSKFLYEDIVNNNLKYKFKEFIYNLKKKEDENQVYVSDDPFKLMSEAGYNLFECKTYEDVNKFIKYYAQNERLCTFTTNRLDSCYVFFAVKKNVDEIKREKFPIPTRQDEYGTSVISIQFLRGKNNTLSIKNRYNHSVQNPDATFSNNLENIIPGLTKSFEHFYNLNINQTNQKDFELPGYVKANDGKFYKYNYEINNIYYCPNNIIIKDFIIDNSFSEKEKYIIMDYFIVDLVKKSVYLYDTDIKETAFLEMFKNIKKIEINKIKDNKEKELKFIFDGYNIVIKLDKYNKMISFKTNIFTSLKDNFLINNVYLENIELDKIYEIGRNFMSRNQRLKHLSIPETVKIEYNFLKYNNSLENFVADNLNIIGDFFMPYNKNMKNFSADNLIIVGNSFLKSNQEIKCLFLPNLRIVQDYFMHFNYFLEKIIVPNLEKVGNNFLPNNNKLIAFNAPNLRQIGKDFMFLNNSLKELVLPSLKKIGERSLEKNTTIENIVFPPIDKKCKFFGLSNKNLKKILNKNT